MDALKAPSSPSSPEGDSGSGGSASGSSAARSPPPGAERGSPASLLSRSPSVLSVAPGAWRRPSLASWTFRSGRVAPLSKYRLHHAPIPDQPTQSMLMSIMRPLPVRGVRKRAGRARREPRPPPPCGCRSPQSSPRPLCHVLERHAAAFYGPPDARNPLLAAFGRELRGVLGFLRRGHGRPPADPEQRHDRRRRGANTLFNIWINYGPRLPVQYYNETLLKVGDFLIQIKEYKLALLYCFERYLSQFNSTLDDNEMDVYQFKNIFFPKGVDDKLSILTFHALQGKCICVYKISCVGDVFVQNEESLNQCFKILSYMRLLMQVAFPWEHLCWIIYNGSIHIYTICRKLMIIGYSAKVLEYLLWAAICMESSIPLLGVNYLTWRATLYTAVCQCYYDCQAGIQAEIFARRSLGKIEDLVHLQVISATPPKEEAKKSFREATIKMAVMIFKRAVFEPRRKMKSLIRVKPRVTIKETQSLPWPRTTTEKLLVEMFDNSAAQFLAIVESLSDSRRRVLQTGSPTSEDYDIRDVISELFMASAEIMSDMTGGPVVRRKFDFFKTVCPGISQIRLAIEGQDGISIAAVVKLIKLAFTFEEWNLFNCTAGQMIIFLQSQSDPDSKKAAMDLRLLAAMEPLINVKRNKGLNLTGEGGSSAKEGFKTSGKKIAFQEIHMFSGSYSDDIFHLASTLYSFICESTENIRPDNEIVVDMIVFLWQKCKMGIQRIPTARTDYFKFFQKIKTNKWIHVLWQINEIILAWRIGDLDPVLVAEVALRLSELLETLGNPAKHFKRTSSTGSRANFEHSAFHRNSSDILPILKKTSEEQLLLAYETLDRAVTVIGMARTEATLPDGTSVYDHCYSKVIPTTGEKNASKPLTANDFMMDLQLEILLAQQRVAVTLLDQLRVWDTPPPKTGHPKEAQNTKQPTSTSWFTEAYVLKKINKNQIAKAIYLMQKALIFFQKDRLQDSSNKLLEEALSLIRKTEVEQNALYSYQKAAAESKIPHNKIPLPPLLISRTHCSVTFKPAPFHCEKKVAWYTILGCPLGKCIEKVRLNSNHLPNTGEPVPANDKTIFEIVGLEPNEKYIFAVAAYCDDGQLCGEAIGETSKPILVYKPISIVTTRLYLTEVAFQVGKYSLAKKAFAPVWDYFVYTPSPENQSIVSLNSTLTVTLHRLHMNLLSECSTILLYHFLRCIFVTSNINIAEQKLFCDAIRGDEVFTSSQKYPNLSPQEWSETGLLCHVYWTYRAHGVESWQTLRITECQRILVAIELSTYLNDPGYSLQAIVQCYGLLAPLIFHNIVLVPVIQILIKCLVILQEISGVVFPKRQIGTFESIQHMIACSVYYTAKVLRSWREYELAVIIINIGKRLLDTSQGYSSNVSKIILSEDEQDEVIEEGTTSSKKSKKSKTQIIIPDKISEHLNLMEAQLLKLTKQYPTLELTGTEDPLFLYPIILTWNLKSAMKEVFKFKTKPRFLEFFVQVMKKCLIEEKFHYVVEMTNAVQSYLKRRNDNFLGIKKTHTTEVSDANEDLKKYKAAAMEIHKSTELPSIQPKAKKKDILRDYFAKRLSLSELPDSEKYKRMDVRKIALKILSECLSPKVARHSKRKKLHRLFIEELPWRAQMNIHLASAHFSMFRIRIGERKKMKVCSTQNMSFRGFNPDVFSLYNSGTLLVEESYTAENYKAMLDFLLSSKGRKINVSAVETDEFSYSSSKVSDTESPKMVSCEAETCVKERTTNFGILEHFTKAFVHCRRAVVLAHRGGYWTLLQNATRTLWNYALDVQLLLKQAHAVSKTFPVSKDIIIFTLVLPFTLASDALLDMLLDLQNSKSVKISDDNKDFGVPSVYGPIKDDNGGFNLTFEDPFDDVNLVDLKYISDFILKTLEILYRVEKWETLAYIALQFNEITHERYTEQVSPLLIYAQRKLLERMQKFSGQKNLKIPDTAEDKVNLRNIIERQPCPAFLPNEVGWPGGFIDFQQDGLHSEIYQANRLVSVPLDVKETLKYFRDSLNKSRYHNRALRYSRKLLTLFLANAQENTGGINNPKFFYGKVEFSLGTEEMFLPTPPDLSREKFTISTTVESKTLPPSHFQLVVASYEKTIDTLEMNNKIDLKIQALHELGNLHNYAANRREAFKCWSQALDAILKRTDVLHTWKEITSPATKTPGIIMDENSIDYSIEFLSKAGIWGCLQGGIIAAKMAQYILTSNVSEKKEGCILASFFFKGLLRTSLVHPKHDHEYAQYEINKLIPGLDLFCDRHRADVTAVLSSLIYICYQLHSLKHNLIILPLISLYQYFAAEICQDVFKCVEARILKTEILIDLGFFSEAYNEISNLYGGKNIPTAIPSGLKFSGKVKIGLCFEAGKPILHKENIQALDELLNRGVPTSVTSLGQIAFIYKFTLVKMRFFTSLAATINCVPESDVKAFFLESPERSKIQVSPPKEYAKEDDSSVVQLFKMREELTPNMLKGILLTEAEDKLLMLIENAESSIGKKMTRFNPVELEIMIEVKLQLAAIAQQRQRAPFSTAIAFTAIKILQDANIFQRSKEKIYEGRDESDAMEPLGMSAREHLNIHMWLKCRLALLMACVSHIRGMGVMKENDVTECRYLINEVFVEAQNWNDIEMQAEVLVQAIKLDLQERHPVANIIGHLQSIINLLQGKSYVSPRGYIILVKSLLLLDDLMKVEEPENYLSPGNENLNLLNQAHAIIIEQVLSLGEMIRLPSSDTDYIQIMFPLKNIYLPHFNLMAKTKMRIAHMLAKKLASSGMKDLCEWASVMHVFDIAMSHCKTAAMYESELEAEILFEKGKLERQMFMIDEPKPWVNEDLFAAIKLSLKNEQNSGLIRKSYLEIALAYLHERNLKISAQSKVLSQDENASKEILPDRVDKHLTLSWIAIRAASQVSESTIAAQNLIGQKSIKLEKIKNILFQNIPEFAIVDIATTFADFLTANYKATYKAFFSSSSQSEVIPDNSSADHDLYTTESDESEEQNDLEISWVQLVRYYVHLLRINNMNTLLASPKPVFLTNEIFHTSIFNEDLILRQKELHNFLKKFLTVFTPACIDSFPRELLPGIGNLPIPEKPQERQSIRMQREMTLIIEKLARSVSSPSPSILPEFMIDFATSTVSKDLCFQWYLPALEKPPNETELKILLLYAFNTRPVKVYDVFYFSPTALFSGFSWIPLSKVMVLHEKLSGLRKEVETLLLHTRTVSPERRRSSSRRSSPSMALEVPEIIILTREMKTVFLECCTEIKRLLLNNGDLPLETEVPFEVSLSSILKLEMLFDPSNGSILKSGNIFNWIVSFLV